MPLQQIRTKQLNTTVVVSKRQLEKYFFYLDEILTIALTTRPRVRYVSQNVRVIIEITTDNRPDNEESESQHSSQSFEQVNYGTQPDEMVRSFEDYDWELGRMIRYCRNDKGGTDRL